MQMGKNLPATLPQLQEQELFLVKTDVCMDIVHSMGGGVFGDFYFVSTVHLINESRAFL